MTTTPSSATRGETEASAPDRPAAPAVWRDACRPSEARGPLRAVLRQFGRPAGPLGHLIGAVMAGKKDSRRRALWTVDLLEIGPDDAVLEVGFGPGLALEEACRRASRGRVVGIDHSPVMVRQASRRLRRHLVAGRAELHQAAVEELDALPGLGRFDRIFAINSLQFWPHPEAALAALCDRLHRGGRLALTFQPPWRGAGDSDARRAGEQMTALLRQAGLESPSYRLLELDGAPAACALADKEAR